MDKVDLLLLGIIGIFVLGAAIWAARIILKDQ